MRLAGIWTFALVLLSVSCATVKIDGNMRQGYHQKLDSVCVVVTSLRAADQPFFGALSSVLEQEFKARGVRSAVHLGEVEVEPTRNFWTQKPEGPLPPAPSLPTLDAKQLAAWSGFSPRFLLTISPSSRGFSTTQTLMASPNGMMPTSNTSQIQHLRCALSEVEGGLMVWKGEIEMKWPGGAQMFPGFGLRPGFGPRAERPIQVDPAKFTERLMAQLQQNGLLDKKP